MTTNSVLSRRMQFPVYREIDLEPANDVKNSI